MATATSLAYVSVWIVMLIGCCCCTVIHRSQTIVNLRLRSYCKHQALWLLLLMLACCYAYQFTSILAASHSKQPYDRAYDYSNAAAVRHAMRLCTYSTWCVHYNNRNARTSALALCVRLCLSRCQYSQYVKIWVISHSSMHNNSMRKRSAVNVALCQSRTSTVEKESTKQSSCTLWRCEARCNYC
jgi:hypothetical protein